MDTPRRVEHQQTDRGYVPVYATGTVEQPWESYSTTDLKLDGQEFILVKEEDILATVK